MRGEKGEERRPNRERWSYGRAPTALNARCRGAAGAHYHPALSRRPRSTLSPDGRVRHPREPAVRRDDCDRPAATRRIESQPMKSRHVAALALVGW
jgi:hypothetical protein